MIQKGLAKSFAIGTDVVPAGRVTEFSRLFSQTSLQEREALYAVARYAYSGKGDVWDIGCAAGGSSYCLGAGLQDSAVSNADARVKCFDLFDGYAAQAFEGHFPNNISDLDIFHAQTDVVRDFVKAERLNLATDFEGYSAGTSVEIAHIDAAKTPKLWGSIFQRLSTTVIPGKSIWIYQDFERARLPWQIYTFSELLKVGEIIGGANYGSVYFRFHSRISKEIAERIVQDDFSIDERVANVRAVFAIIRGTCRDFFSSDVIDLDDIENTAVAYCYYWIGQKARARRILADTSSGFLSSAAHRIYAEEILSGTV